MESFATIVAVSIFALGCAIWGGLIGFGIAMAGHAIADAIRELKR